MRIAVIGAGAVGRALGPRWVKARHDVVYSVRTTGTEDMASFLAQTGGCEELGAEAVRGADIVVLALPWARTPKLPFAGLATSMERSSSTA
jgi:predicted dinucleotide-binding enzyme